jgi:hypothetical protein
MSSLISRPAWSSTAAGSSVCASAARDRERVDAVRPPERASAAARAGHQLGHHTDHPLAAGHPRSARDVAPRVPAGTLDRKVWLDRVTRCLARAEEIVEVRIARDLVRIRRQLTAEANALDRELPVLSSTTLELRGSWRARPPSRTLQGAALEWLSAKPCGCERRPRQAPLATDAPPPASKSRPAPPRHPSSTSDSASVALACVATPAGRPLRERAGRLSRVPESREGRHLRARCPSAERPIIVKRPEWARHRPLVIAFGEAGHTTLPEVPRFRTHRGRAATQALSTAPGPDTEHARADPLEHPQ